MGNLEKPWHWMDHLISYIPYKNDSKDLHMNSWNPANGTVGWDILSGCIPIELMIDVHSTQHVLTECIPGTKMYLKFTSCSLGHMSGLYGSQRTHVYMHSHTFIHFYGARNVCISGRMK